ncbi:hypothetical protein PMAYCL1PPCAC_01864 [Pristionchus mayeri]|uniref:Nuclear receptor n=1 Tax=Pristionchus mayeri TaxID=1317129 RepID=A0AAN5C7D6_9BILA|nr:hypothetical protein PMAYCL1PPCAC_01864 [Pristionchus mayeri]
MEVSSTLASADSCEEKTRISPSWSQTRLCRICSDKSDGAHFGVDSCRACAAFFRRSIVLKKKYVCRQGGNACDINKSVRCMCRKCRFVKCLQSGMLPENVHQRNDDAPSSTPQPSTSSISAVPPVPSVTSIPSVSSVPSTSSQASIASPAMSAASVLSLNLHASETIASVLSDFPSLSSFTAAAAAAVAPPPPPPTTHADELIIARRNSSSSSDGWPFQRPQAIRPFVPLVDHCQLLKRINANYNQMTALRRSSELALFPTNSLKDIFAGANGELRPCTFALLDRIMKAAVPICADFCNTTFPEFANLVQDDKWVLFRNFITIIFHFECGIRTSRCGLKDTQKRPITVTTYIDLEKHEEFFTKSDPPMDVKPEFVELMKEKATCPGSSRLLEMMHKLEITDLELAAFIGLCLWSPSIAAVSDRVHETCIAAREAIFRDLHSYYRHVEMLEEYAVRLGDFMGLFANIQTQTHRMREEMELLSLFDVFQKESFVYNLLKM